MNQIENRKDVNSFYAKIRLDEMLGPIFNNHIPENQWAAHLDKLTDFWETNLFGIAKFKGNPTQKHINVDKNLNNGIEQKHFGKWLELWFDTIDEMFSGENADKAKNTARKMASGQFLAIWHNRS
jgi:hemoglobin